MEDAFNTEFLGKIRFVKDDSDPLDQKLNIVLNAIKPNPHLRDQYDEMKVSVRSRVLKSAGQLQTIQGILWTAMEQNYLLVVIKPNAKYHTTEILTCFVGKIDQ